MTIPWSLGQTLWRVVMPDLRPKLVSAQAQPVTRADLKAQARIDGSEEDSLLDAYIGAACDHVAAIIGRQLRSEVWSWSFANPSGAVVLPLAPVQSVDVLTYLDKDGAQQSLSVADFDLIADVDRPVLQPKSGVVWPATAIRPDAITVRMTVGMATLPAALRVAILLLASHWVQNREAVVLAGSPVELPLAVSALVEPWKRRWIAA